MRHNNFMQEHYTFRALPGFSRKDTISEDAYPLPYTDMRGFLFFQNYTLFLFNLRSVAPCNYIYKNYTRYACTFVVRTPYVMLYIKRLCVFLAVYYLKSIITYIATHIVCMELLRISRNVQIREIWCFPEIPGIPGKSPENPPKTSRENPGFFRVLRL
jgi:hypothetical protein